MEIAHLACGGNKLVGTLLPVQIGLWSLEPQAWISCLCSKLNTILSESTNVHLEYISLPWGASAVAALSTSKMAMDDKMRQRR